MRKKFFGLVPVFVVLFLVGGQRIYAASGTNGFGSGSALRPNSILIAARVIPPRMVFGIGDNRLDWPLRNNRGHDNDRNDNDDHGRSKGRKVGVPEPATLALILVGLAGVGAIRRWRKPS
jgi:hypothetical protein